MTEGSVSATLSLRERLTSPATKPAGAFTLAGNGVTVHLRRWPLSDRMRIVALSKDSARPPLERQAEMLALILCDERNARLFPDGDAGIYDVAFGSDAEAIVTAALEANGLTGEKKAESDTPTSSAPTPS